MSVIYEAQSIKLKFNIGIATTDTTSIVLKYRKPVEDYSNRVIEGTFTETVEVETASTGDCYIEVPYGTMTPDGEWVLWSYVTATDGNIFIGDPYSESIKIPGVNITNKAYVKSYLGYTTTTYDFKIDALIPMYEALYLKIRNAPWPKVYNETTEELINMYPIGANTTIAQMIGYEINHGDDNGILTSEHIGSYSWSSDGKTSNGFPIGITSVIKRYARGE
jgi:hypothetical protein